MPQNGGAEGFTPGGITMYRWVRGDATYRPDSPWPGAGRFDDGITKTLYIAATPEGAVAEFFRSLPEFVGLSDHLNIRLFGLDLLVEGRCQDVRTVALAEAAGIAFDRLRSSEFNPDSRFLESRVLARNVLANGGTGIAYPSAAAVWETWNLVVFNDQARGAWVCRSQVELDAPSVDVERIRLIDPPPET